MHPINADQVAQEIAQLRLIYGDLADADDDELWQLSLESETGLSELLSKIERARVTEVSYVKTLENLINIHKERIARFERKNEYRRSLIQRLLTLAGVRRYEIAEATYSIRAVPPAPKVSDVTALPDAACRIKREPDMAKVRALLAEGPVAGAYLTNGYETLTIRTT